MYTKTPWNNGATPPINAVNLNKMEQGIYDAHAKADANEADIASNYADLNARVSSNDVDIAQNKEDITKNKNDIASLLAGEVMKGAWTPTTGTEYPAASVNWSYYISGVNENGYTFTSGDLTGKVAKNMDKIILTASGWSLIENNLTVSIPNGAVGRINSPLLDLPLKNSLAMKAGVGSVTFTRASTATYIDRYGVLQYSSIENPARFEKDGLLIEGASTNLLTYSEDISVSPWGRDGVTATSDTSTQIQDDVGYHFTRSGVCTIATGTYDFTAYADFEYTTLQYVEVRLYDVGATSGNRFYAIFDLLNGTVEGNGNVGSTNVSAKIEKFGNTYRCIISGNMSITDNVSLMVIHRTNNVITSGIESFTGDSSKNLKQLRHQVEALPFATSYIPTTTAQVTRSKDLCTVTGNGNVPLLDGIENFSVAVTTNFKVYTDKFFTAFSLHNGNSDLRLMSWSALGVRLAADNGSISSTSYISSTNEEEASYIVSFGNYVGTVSKNGVVENNFTATGELINTGIAEIRLGGTESSGDSSYELYGHIKNFKIYDEALTATEVALLGGN